MMNEQADTNEQMDDEVVLLARDASGASSEERRAAHINIEGGEPRLLVMTLPQFQCGYEASKRAIIECDDQPFLKDTELIEILRDFVKEGLFSGTDEDSLQWNVGSVIGLLERMALRSGAQMQRVVVQVKDDLALTISLIPV